MFGILILSWKKQSLVSFFPAQNLRRGRILGMDLLQIGKLSSLSKQICLLCISGSQTLLRCLSKLILVQSRSNYKDRRAWLSMKCTTISNISFTNLWTKGNKKSIGFPLHDIAFSSSKKCKISNNLLDYFGSIKDANKHVKSRIETKLKLKCIERGINSWRECTYIAALCFDFLSEAYCFMTQHYATFGWISTHTLQKIGLMSLLN